MQLQPPEGMWAPSGRSVNFFKRARNLTVLCKNALVFKFVKNLNIVKSKRCIFGPATVYDLSMVTLAFSGLPQVCASSVNSTWKW